MLSPDNDPRLLRVIAVVGLGANWAGLFAALITSLDGGLWRECAMTGGLVAGMAGVILAAEALWGIRYPEPLVVEHVHKVRHEGERVRNTAPVYDLLNLPREDGQTYQATMARRKPAPDIAMSEPQLARVIMFLLDGDGIASARRLAHICTPPETRKVRSWLLRRRWADERNKTAFVNDQGRAGLVELLPHLARE